MGGGGGALEVALPHSSASRRALFTRGLENERILAFVLLTPTLTLLTLFIA